MAAAFKDLRSLDSQTDDCAKRRTIGFTIDDLQASLSDLERRLDELSSKTIQLRTVPPVKANNPESTGPNPNDNFLTQLVNLNGKVIELNAYVTRLTSEFDV